MRIRAFVFSCSLACAGWCLAGQYQDLAAELGQYPTVASLGAKLREGLDPINDPGLRQIVDSSDGQESPAELRKLREAVKFRAAIEAAPSQDGASAQIGEILKNPLYHRQGHSGASNWLGSATDKIRKLVPKFEAKDTPDAPNLSFLSGPWLTYLMWGVLGVAVLGFGVYALSQWRLQRSKRRKASAVLEEDEPERTLDEWLKLADDLESTGKFREAIRCLYVACLLKFDEAGVARFIRSQTNWEHLARIEASPKNRGFDFRPLTRAFDLAWYGFRVKGREDVTQFREGYRNLMEALSQ